VLRGRVVEALVGWCAWLWGEGLRV
jgi:hypothetical protein